MNLIYREGKNIFILSLIKKNVVYISPADKLDYFCNYRNCYYFTGKSF